MTIPVSVAPTVKAACLVGVTAALADESVFVGYAAGPNLPDDMIVFGTIERRLEPHAMVGSLGAGAFLERFTIETIISCFRGGDDAEPDEERAFVLLGVVETFIRTDPTVSGLLVVAEPSSSRTDTGWDEDNKGFVSTITASLQFLAVS